MSSHYLDRENYLRVALFKVGGAKHLPRNHLKHSRQVYLYGQLLQQGKMINKL